MWKLHKVPTLLPNPFHSPPPASCARFHFFHFTRSRVLRYPIHVTRTAGSKPTPAVWLRDTTPAKRLFKGKYSLWVHWVAFRNASTAVRCTRNQVINCHIVSTTGLFDKYSCLGINVTCSAGHGSFLDKSPIFGHSLHGITLSTHTRASHKSACQM